MGRKGVMGRLFCVVWAMICVLAWLVGVSVAGFSLPPEVYRIGSLKDAQGKAVSMNVPVVFVYSDENTRCGLARTATLDVMEELKGRTVVVYVSRNDSDRIPQYVIKAMNSPAAGKFIPKTVAVNPKTGRVEMIIPYISDRNKRIEEIRKIKTLIPR
ncbi:MAG: hypothetical protein A4E61_00216 [Syntrophorhabdus sp. PtaB.Bin184]|jgi:hypothetical protein|nr:MAG: hypothetical protein A4E61_00216 [Syntrophorhabdus sp. PtaB.Bin184]